MFGRRFPLFSVAGINIGVDVSWFLIAFLLSWTLAVGYFPFYYPKFTAGSYWIMGISGMLGLFISIILHELGHALTAKKFNVPISEITLFVFGGVAQLKHEPPSPKAEFLVAVAGPIVSVFISVFMSFITGWGKSLELSSMITGVTAYLAMINMVVVVFNLIPAFPLDGGRIFRALLWWWKDDLGWATTITSKIGSGFGFFLIFMGFFTLLTGNIFVGMWWIILGLFLQQAASLSKTQYYVRHELEGERVERYMIKDPITIPPTITLKEFLDDYVFRSFHHLYPVVEEKELRGYVTLTEVKSIDHDKWSEVTVEDVLVPLDEIKTVSEETQALEALNIFQETNASTLLVADGKTLKGMLTAQDLYKLISIKIDLETSTR
ncbi:MAG: site-2 protease family protein [Chlamydiales bacterium]